MPAPLVTTALLTQMTDQGAVWAVVAVLLVPSIKKYVSKMRGNDHPSTMAVTEERMKQLVDEVQKLNTNFHELTQAMTTLALNELSVRAHTQSDD
tara:strand:- start:178 stop:462 length:285 start_codon:yes stop_codon:yes gene_type:complete